MAFTLPTGKIGPARGANVWAAPPETPRAAHQKNPKCHQTTHHPAAAVHPGGVAAGRTASVAAPAPTARKPQQQFPSNRKNSPSGRRSPPSLARSQPRRPPVLPDMAPFPATRRPVPNVRSVKSARNVQNAPSVLSVRNVPPARNALRASVPPRSSRSPRRVSMSATCPSTPRRAICTSSSTGSAWSRTSRSWPTSTRKSPRASRSCRCRPWTKPSAPSPNCTTRNTWAASSW
jgi:hypothetical protein